MNTRLKPTSTYCLVAGFMVCTLILSGWKFHPNSASKIIQDTTKSGKKESATYSRKSIITYDKDGTPHEEVIEDFSGDEEMKEAMKIIAPFPLTMPTTPGFPGFISPGFFEGLMVPPFTDEMMDRDTVDFKNFRFNGKMLEDLRDMEMMMKENFENFQPKLDNDLQRLGDELEMLFGLGQNLNGLHENLSEEMDKLGKDMQREFGQPSDEMNGQTKRDQSSDFERAVQQELVNDGYLDPAGKIESISWGPDEIKFNGKAIKSQHIEKYKLLREKYAGTNSQRGRPE